MLAFDYPPSQEGFWGPVTSTINWCEEDYYATIYAAEIVNTITNIAFIYLAIKGMTNVIANRHGLVFFFGYLGYFIVCSGSVLFHTTLKYPMQLIDELGMIYTTCIMFYASFARCNTTLVNTIHASSLVVLCAFITGYYHYCQDPTFHQVSYGILTAILVVRTVYVMEVGIRPYWRNKKRDSVAHNTLNGSACNGHANGTAAHCVNPKLDKVETQEQISADKRDAAIIRTMWKMGFVGLSIFLTGFFLWSMDNIHCGTLRRWRRMVGLPWGIVLEAHGWWHMFSGIGAYYFIVWATWVELCLENRRDEYELVWPRMWTSVPYVVRRRDADAKQNGKAGNGGVGNGKIVSMNGHANGKAKAM